MIHYISFSLKKKKKKLEVGFVPSQGNEKMFYGVEEDNVFWDSNLIHKTSLWVLICII